ncbi:MULTISPECIES: pilus assembly protein PilM [unclassified Pseudomonas]|uniref:type IV pilus biogenesis protein PilM n=1 Tax=unclassified Pseudomonas TaxID=196821 RepID=UPI00244BECF1|nr:MULTISPECIES: pilus assembly protein PilM [unclassified Pseudomonas]MDH0302706.1 pilus assembly protein PilM [Pseudomonas sp. GD04091]MDH1983575.1 pilus assembly protein PilM [Pseudomonas sp. GD03689]
MLGRFGRGTGSLLGVEIAHDSIRMLQLRHQRGRCRVAGWAREPFGATLRGPGLLDDAGTLVRALRQAHGRCATRQREVALALPASQVICKICRLPAGESDLGIESQLLDQADQLFPFPLDDLALDFQVLGASVDDPGQVDALVVACRQSQIDPLEQLFAQAGLRLVAVEVDSIALQRALVEGGCAGKTMLQLEAGEMVMHCWLHACVPQRQHVAPMASDQWAQSVERLWHASGGQARGDELLLTGALASAERAAQLAQLLGVACRMVRPGVQSGPGAIEAGQEPSMALAYGLALGGLA